ncbi:MAG: hypothetical protein DMG59_17120 [Acidobacteria bacterium]|nr:MAG: hypothetical protein DMG59_17120 [Acidobacteriota bacterium]
MHRLIRDHLEEVLTGSNPSAEQHLRECQECSAEIAAMREQAAMLREWRAPDAALDPQPGFYARVLERIEARGATSIWSLFFESPFGRRIAVASLALALLLGVYLVSTEQSAEQTVVAGPQLQLLPALPGEDEPGLVLTRAGAPDRDAVLVNLVTYQEQ